MKDKIQKISFAVLLLAITPNANASKQYGSVYANKIISVYDGDTFRANIANYPSIIGESIGIRINGIDTPEIRGKCDKEKQLAAKAKQHTAQLLTSALFVELRNMRRGKYFRIVADVYADGVNVSDSLYNNGLGYVYHGGTKLGWCD